MNFPFIVVLVAATSGVLSDLALRNVAPQAGPAVALILMAAALIAGGRLTSKRPARRNIAR